MSLSDEQIHLFRHNGFLKLPDRLPAARVEELKRTIQTGIVQKAEPVSRDSQGRVVRLSQIWDRGGVFAEALSLPQVLDCLECLLGPNIELVLNRHNHATLRLAGEGADYFHRDVLQWTRTIVTVIFYLEESTMDNGCTLVVPGSQMLPGIRANELSSDERVLGSRVLDQAVPVPMPAGGLLVIDSMLMHSAGRNLPSGSRMSMTAGYHSVDELSGPNSKRVLLRGERIYGGNDR